MLDQVHQNVHPGTKGTKETALVTGQRKRKIMENHHISFKSPTFYRQSAGRTNSAKHVCLSCVEGKAVSQTPHPVTIHY